jgi:hypothetical protein
LRPIIGKTLTGDCQQKHLGILPSESELELVDVEMSLDIEEQVKWSRTFSKTRLRRKTKKAALSLSKHNGNSDDEGDETREASYRI